MKLEHGTLVLVADGAKLLLFENEGDEKYPVLRTLSHEEASNPPSREQGTDAPGRTQSSVGKRRSSYGETDWHKQAEEAFARNASFLLEAVAATQAEAKIVVVAAPRTLGIMREYYGPQTKQRLVAEISKDLAAHTTYDIVGVITTHEA